MDVEFIVLFVVVALVFGILIGRYQIEENFIAAYKKAKKPVAISCWASFSIYIVYLFIAHFDSIIMNSKNIKSTNDLKEAIISNPANLHMISIGIFLSIASLLSFIIRIPTSQWSHIKLFGLFEGTRKIEEIKKIANEEIVSIDKRERLRLETIEYISNTDFYIDLSNIVEIEAGKTKIDSAIIYEIEKLIKIMIEGEFDTITVNSGSIQINDHNNIELSYLPIPVRETIHYISDEKPFNFKNINNRNIFTARMQLLDITDTYFIIYFDIEGEGFLFEEDDGVMMASINNIINQHLRLIEFEKAPTNASSVV